jgi:putative ABC transport system permease protein
MDLLTSLRLGLQALGKNKFRAGLTVLGLVIGVAAVTTIVSVGQSAGALVQNELQGLGTNVVIIFSGSGRTGGLRGGRGTLPTLTADDAEAIVRECPAVRAACPIVGARGQVVHGNLNWRLNEIQGVTKDYLTVRNWELRAGGFFSDRDVHSAAKVCVLGQTVVEKLFQTANPLGREIRINSIPFLVIGILQPKGATLAGEDQDDIILAPYTTVATRLRRSNFDKVDVIFASARTPGLMAEAQQDVELLLRERHKIRRGDPPDFEVHTTAELANVLGAITAAMTALLAAIGGVSLLVGGVGIMNIMLVSVTERTREIGIRMALGASPADILRQFLSEAVLLSLMGGLIGLTFGVGASFGATAVINSVTTGPRWPVHISSAAAAVALAVSGAVGVFFGFYPARRASRLDPIEALRYE